MGGSQTGGTGVSPASVEEEKRKLLLATAIIVVGVTFLYSVRVKVGKNVSVSKEKSSRLIAHPRGQEHGIAGKKIAHLIKEG